MFLLVVICNFDVKRVLCAFRPFKAKLPLLVDANAELSIPVTPQCLKVVTRQKAQIMLTFCVFQNRQALFKLLL
jgi:hypothetical protein